MQQTEDFTEIYNKMVEFRRHFHENPELSMLEFETTKFIREQLKLAGYTEIYSLAGTGTIAVVKGELNESILVRGDIDALPVDESKLHTIQSKVKGVSHACGHDIHAALLLGTAIYTMQQVKAGKKLQRGVKFCFQPGEESGNNGAEQMILDGSYDIFEAEPKVVACSGLHVSSQLYTGQVGYKSGPFTGSSDKFEINITGLGGHAMCPNDTVDGIQVGTQLCNSIYQIRGRNVNQSNPVSISIGMFQAGSRPNVIEAKAKIQGGVRAMQPADRDVALKMIETLCEGAAKQHGAQVEFKLFGGYRGIFNDPTLEKRVNQTLTSVVGPDNLVKLNMGMAGEDFYNFSERKPSAFWVLGGGPELEVDETELKENQLFSQASQEEVVHQHHEHYHKALKNTHHSSSFEINEKCLLIGFKIWREFIFGSQHR